MALAFRYPVSPAPSIAVYDQLEAFPVEPAADIQTAALPAGMLPLAMNWKWSPERAMVIFTGPFWGILTEDQRETVWKNWGVPVYECRRDASGAVLAQECDAHDGLHVVPGATPPEPALTTRCGCGLTTPRIAVRRSGFKPAHMGAAA